MKRPRKWRSASAAALLAVAIPTVVLSTDSSAKDDERERDGAREWVGSWSAAVTAAEPTGRSHDGLNNQSLRMIVHTSVGGDQLRIRLTNTFSDNALTVGHATVAKPDQSTPDLSDVDPGTLHDLTFNGQPSATLLKGDELLSDPVDLPVDNLRDLVVTLFLPAATGPVTWHAISRQSSFIGAGDLTAATAGTGFTTTRNCCWFFLSGVDVLRHKAAGSIVVLADSIGDGSGNTVNAKTRWPDLLATRLVDAQRGGRVPGVLNASLAGNRLNHEGSERGAGGFPGFVQFGTNTGARLNEDVFPQTGVRTVLFDLGINDIWMSGDSADAIIDSIRKIASQIRERGLRLVVATLAPFEGLEGDGVWTPDKDATRNAVNTFLRGSREFDGLIDFDALLRDPAQPSKLRSEFDSGDHIHPNDAGSQAMADLIPLRLIS
jgi:lysophospholipase L1-like esterase